VLLLFIFPEVMTVFTLVSSLSAVLVIYTWSTILVAYLGYRRRHPERHARASFRLPGGVPMAWLSLAFLLFVLVLLALQPDTRMALYAMPLWFAGLAIAYRRLAGRGQASQPPSQPLNPGATCRRSLLQICIRVATLVRWRARGAGPYSRFALQ
jgi:D-serine/D-alanine/glycine transporter